MGVALFVCPLLLFSSFFSTSFKLQDNVWKKLNVQADHRASAFYSTAIQVTRHILVVAQSYLQSLRSLHNGTLQMLCEHACQLHTELHHEAPSQSIIALHDVVMDSTVAADELGEIWLFSGLGALAVSSKVSNCLRSSALALEVVSATG